MGHRSGSPDWRPKEEIDYYNGIRCRIDWDNPKRVNERVLELFKLHDNFREKSCINLTASENVMSPTAKAFLGSDLGFRTCDGPVGKKVFGSGIQYLEEMEAICVEASRRLFNVEYVEHRLLGGTMGCAVIHFALTNRSDTVMAQSLSSGGVICHRPAGAPKYAGLEVVDLPWDPETMNIDLERFEEEAKKTKPKLIVLGALVMLFPYPLKKIAGIAKDIGARIAYDGAHIGGLVAGGRFQDPIGEGADLLMVNTHKQMGGPPGALILSNNADVARKISGATFPFLVTTPYCNKFASLAVTLSELMEFGESYAGQIVANAKTLGRELDERGMPVLCRRLGYTESHQIMLDVHGLGGGSRVEKVMEEAHIIGNKVSLPGDRPGEPGGLRLGVNEVTRRGMSEKEMGQIADFASRVLVDREDPRRVGEKVSAFMRDFNTVKFCFD